MGIVERGLVPRSVVTLANQARAWSLWVLPVGLACCAGGLEAALRSPRWDALGLGVRAVDEPGAADVLVVAGPVTEPVGAALTAGFGAMGRPRYVMGAGACAASGGLFSDGDTGPAGLDGILPVDVWVPGCPPRPEAILDGLLALGDLIRQEDPVARWTSEALAVAAPSPGTVDVGAALVGLPGATRARVDRRTATVTAADPVGGLHRGLEGWAEGGGFDRALLGVARVDATGGIARTVALATAVEMLAGVEVPRRARWVRAIAGELDRIVVLTDRLARTAAAMDAPAAEGVARIATELARDRLEALSGSRVHHDLVTIGGARADPDADWLVGTVDALAAVWRRLDDLDRYLLAARGPRRRLEGLGTIDAAAALDIGLTGPALRAAGVAHDLRRWEASSPNSPWDGCQWETWTHPSGDAFARTWVRVQEARTACRLAVALADAAPPGPVAAPAPAAGDAIAGSVWGWADHPDGDVGVLVVADAVGDPWRVHLRTPAVAARAAVAQALEGARLDDAPVVLASLGLAPAEADR